MKSFKIHCLEAREDLLPPAIVTQHCADMIDSCPAHPLLPHSLPPPGGHTVELARPPVAIFPLSHFWRRRCQEEEATDGRSD